MYNPALGKFLSVDPLASSFPFYTPYQFAGNKPIWKIDLDGLEEDDSDANFELSLEQYWAESDRIREAKLGFVSRVELTIVKEQQKRKRKKYPKLGGALKAGGLLAGFLLIPFELNEGASIYYDAMTGERLFSPELVNFHLYASYEEIVTDHSLLGDKYLEDILNRHQAGDELTENELLYLNEAKRRRGERIAGEIASKWTELFTCTDCAEEIRNTLIKEGISGSTITLRANANIDGTNNYDFIFGLDVDVLISTNGIHQGVRIGNKVFDNLNPNGRDYDDWIKSFDTGYNGKITEEIDNF